MYLCWQACLEGNFIGWSTLRSFLDAVERISGTRFVNRDTMEAIVIDLFDETVCEVSEKCLVGDWEPTICRDLIKYKAGGRYEEEKWNQLPEPYRLYSPRARTQSIGHVPVP